MREMRDNPEERA